MTEEPILRLAGVSKRFEQRPDLAERLAGLFGAGRPEMRVQAVDAVDLVIRRGEVVGLVGESGCGKSTLGRIVAQLLPPSAGELRWKGVDTGRMDRRQRRATNLAIQMIAQDPAASLNPRMRVREIIGEAPLAHGMIRRSERDAEVGEMLRRVGLDPSMIDRYPHQLSGGQRQRVSIARALTTEPKVIVADESVSMVDVSIRISILNMLMAMRESLGVTIVFITHDLALAKYFAWQGRIAVMYLGRVVEIGKTPVITQHPQHPYTKTLLAAIPEPDPDRTRKKEIIRLRSEDIPRLTELPSGCTFHPRCPWFVPGVCDQQIPELAPVPDSESDALVACTPLTAGGELERYGT